jgi:hypothetical protein
MAYRNNSAGSPASAPDQAAIFVDYDNLYSILEAQSGSGHPSEYASEILDEVRRYLEEGDDTPTILSRAYADFAGLPDGNGAKLQSLLYRDGVEPIMTPASIQGNTAELRLCLDVCNVMHGRPDLRTVVIVTGDRPYLPLVRQVRESGRRALVAAVNPPRPDDGTTLAEDDVYLDARNLLSQRSREDLLSNAPSEDRSSSRSDRSDSRSSRSGRSDSPPPRRYREITNPTARRTVEITEEYFGQYKEVYLTPLLRKLSDVLGEEHDPKSLVSELEAAGAVRLEKRDGYPYDYTVLIVNEDHPDVQEIQDDFYSNGSSYDGGNGYSDYDSSDYDDDYEEDYGDYRKEYDDYEDEYDEDYEDDYAEVEDESTARSESRHDEYASEYETDDESEAEDAYADAPEDADDADEVK